MKDHRLLKEVNSTLFEEKDYLSPDVDSPRSFTVRLLDRSTRTRTPYRQINRQVDNLLGIQSGTREKKSG